MTVERDPYGNRLDDLVPVIVVDLRAAMDEQPSKPLTGAKKKKGERFAADRCKCEQCGPGDLTYGVLCNEVTRTPEQRVSIYAPWPSKVRRP